MKLDKTIKSAIIDVFRNSFSQEIQLLENSIINFAKQIKKSDPVFYHEIIGVLYSKNNGGSPLRGTNNDPLPVDLDSKLETAQIINPGSDLPKPIFNPLLNTQVEDFIDQQLQIEKLIENNLFPASKLLLVGPPGTGKTMLAKYIASRLNKQLVILDLATVISSFLGKTGLNLKKVINYAKRNKTILLLDEFDAIAKRRDDLSDLGELKRVVNVLLVELDSWPSGALLIATSNHPDLLDKAVWRRFDDILQIENPSNDEIHALLKSNLINFKEKNINIVTPFLVGLSASAICSYSNKVKRRLVMKNSDEINSLFFELSSFLNKDIKGEVCKKAKEILGEDITVRELADITGLSPSGVQYHLSKEKHA